MVAVYIAHGVDARHIGAPHGIGGDSGLGDRHPHGLKAQALGVGAAAHGQTGVGSPLRCQIAARPAADDDQIIHGNTSGFAEFELFLI